MAVVEDFGISCGIAPASASVSGGIGERFLQTYNLVSSGHAITGTGSFTLSLPVNTGNVGGYTTGAYTIRCGTSTGIGIYYFLQANIVNANITLTI